MITFTQQDIEWYNRLQCKWRYKFNSQMGHCLEMLEGNPGNDFYCSSYELITNPQYGFCDLFLSSESPWQDDFFKWFKSKKYMLNITITDTDKLSYNIADILTKPYPCIMMEGYIRQYFEERSK